VSSLAVLKRCMLRDKSYEIVKSSLTVQFF
jgi:hypothetical protein